MYGNLKKIIIFLRLPFTSNDITKEKFIKNMLW